MAGFFIWLICLITYLIYHPALSAPWTFDDTPNLQGLTNVTDLNSAITFITTGTSSDLGRPLSLASFLINTADWPSNPTGFRYTNILLHLINGLIIAWLGLAIARAQKNITINPVWFSVILSSLWTFHPLLASSSLMAVQRMTLLAASTTLLGLLAFAYGRKQIAYNPLKGYVWMSCGLTLGATIGVLAKENAALIPFFAAALNYTVLAHIPTGQRKLWRAWQILFFIGPALLLLTYTVSHWEVLVAGYSHRPFSLTERLLTEPLVLWHYIKQIITPDIMQMGPFHDGANVIKNLSLIAILSILGWVAAITISLILRRKTPWLSFAILWFLAGHLLESTLFNLEIYFEHRNYLPSLGPLALATYLVWHNRIIWSKIFIIIVIAGYGTLLWQTTTLWGTPLLAAERWAAEHPNSTRAAQHLTQRYIIQGDIKSAQRVIKQASLTNQQASDLAIQSLQVQCNFTSRAEFQHQLKEILKRAKQFHASNALADATGKLIQMKKDGQCPELTENDLIQLLKVLLTNKYITQHTQLAHYLHHQLAEIYTHRGDFNNTIHNLKTAFETYPNPATAELIAITFASGGLYKEALDSIDYALSKAPILLTRGNLWETRLDKLKKAITLYAQEN